jgi:poly-gamma-glutamate capsule biosynthesis protein CapA/YwtB (metallophosphatase superfamily)
MEKAMNASLFTKGTAAALALATTMTLAATNDADAARRHYRGSNAAGAAVALGAFGLVAGAIAASQERRYYRDRYYGYGPRYGYYGPRYGYYGPRHYYGPRYYRGW